MATYQSAYTGAQIDAAIQKVNNLFSLVYPVGSIYISVNSTSPATLFGGTWEQIQGKFLLASSTTMKCLLTFIIFIDSSGGALTWLVPPEEMYIVGNLVLEELHKLCIIRALLSNIYQTLKVEINRTIICPHTFQFICGNVLLNIKEEYKWIL